MLMYRHVLFLSALLLLTACSTSISPNASLVPDALPTISGFKQWQHWQLPGKQATDYVPGQLEGREVVAVRADASASACALSRRIWGNFIFHGRCRR